jgi:hypothetical protein
MELIYEGNKYVSRSALPRPQDGVFCGKEFIKASVIQLVIDKNY